MVPQDTDAPATICYAMSFSSWFRTVLPRDKARKVVYHESVAELVEPGSEFVGRQRSLCEPKVYLIGNGQIVHVKATANGRVE